MVKVINGTGQVNHKVETQYTVGSIAKKYGLSRTALLYYDKMGLLKPSSRSESNYRKYSEADLKKLEQICRYRQTGISLKEIKQALQSPENTVTHALEKRLDQLNTEIGNLRNQQRLILSILKSDKYLKRIRVMNKERWISLLRASGFSDDEMMQWHAQFEKTAPNEHREFLEFLCIPEGEIKKLRTKVKRL